APRARRCRAAREGCTDGCARLPARAIGRAPLAVRLGPPLALGAATEERAMDVGKTARMLGWFSIGLGAAELLMPGALSRTLGVGRHDRLIRGFGLREIGAGLGLLS